jgi:enolase-phosphatase E1
LPLPTGIRAILTDIEGTTTPIAFVHETLFPFAASRLDGCCARAGDDPRIADAIATLRGEFEKDPREGATSAGGFGNGAVYARHLMQADRKSTGLKALQGIIWEAGYGDGTLKAQVYEDVPRALETWRRAALRLRVFSSGSVLAQKLLFAHSDRGDLTGHFEGYHDTTTGPKKNRQSYVAIAGSFALDTAEILYLSDVVAELDPAREAGMATGLLIRPGNAPAEPGTHPTHETFLDLV